MGTTPSYWLIKSEPSTYSFSDLQKDGRTRWDGVRNFTARNNMRAMKVGDLCLFHHTGDEKRVVGVARVTKEAYADPTAKGEDFSAVDVEPAFALEEPVTLAEIKKTAALKKMQLVTMSRLSVQRVTRKEWEIVLELGKGTGR